jgi:N-acetylneuraminate synthase
MSTVFVIAEVGSCHDGSFDRAMELVTVAHETGANAVKFQYWSSADRMAERRHAPEYRDTYADWAMPMVWIPKLMVAAHKVGLEFMCSTYLPNDVKSVAGFVDRFKIASFEANDRLHLKAHAPFRQQVIISLGMGAQASVIYEELTDEERVRLLHCVSAYPAPEEQLNLYRIIWRDGFSDHSDPCQVMTGAMAVGSGATIIERHIRADSTASTNPDFGHAMPPDLFRTYVTNIRWATAICGDEMPDNGSGVPAEAPMLKYRVR